MSDNPSDPPKSDPLSGFRRREDSEPEPSSEKKSSDDSSSRDDRSNRDRGGGREKKSRPPRRNSSKSRKPRGGGGDRDRSEDRSNGDSERGEAGGGDRNNPRGRGRSGNRNRSRNRGRRNRSGDRSGDRERNGDRPERKPREPREPIDPGPPVPCEGIIEISPKGFGFLRQREESFIPDPDDVFVTPELVSDFSLRDGVWISGTSQQGHRGPQLTEIKAINGGEPEAYRDLPYFEELTAINPDKRLTLETTPDRKTTRVIDMMTPVGRGQRGLIVAPPRTGKTTLLQHMAEAIIENYEDPMHLMILLVDERPEEVTDFQRTIPQAEIFASSNDSDVKNHTRIAQLAIERAKRLVEAGEHVFLLLDSITRLARAFNNATKGKGRTMSGGIDIKALEMPRKLFAAARNTREAGSLTIIATALIQTNSKMDELIYQEFKGTGNMELVLDRALAQNYVYPAVDIAASGTRREELILPAHMLEKIHIIRRGLAGHKPIEAMERLLSFLDRFPNNAQMLMEIKAPSVA